MTGFPRDIERALGRSYDLIVIGGGIYGMVLTLEAARRGMKPLLVERGDFGGATSLNSLRILHGGLRYLQNVDLPRFFESVRQRDWFMKHFEPLCRELPCLMPLYGKGLKRPAVFRVALGINNRLSGSTRVSRGRVLGVEETIRRFPMVRREGLAGGGLWYDGQVLSPQRLHAELLRWAAGRGATVLNYVEALALKKDTRVRGLVTDAGEFTAPVVLNAAGPWSREVAERLDEDRPELMTPSLTFNVVLKAPPPSEAAVAVESSRVFFITPHRAGVTFVGTVHEAWEEKWEPSEAMLDRFLRDLNEAVPGWEVARRDIVRVTPGVLPSKGPGEAEMAHRSTFVRHAIDGLYSICGIKYTTAQRFAAGVLERIFGRLRADESTPSIGERARFVNPGEVMNLGDDDLGNLLAEEAVTRVEDLLERRMDWIVDEAERAGFEKRVAAALDEREALAT